MEFCIIGPTAGLERYATLSKTHLVLAHIKDGAYVEFYRKRRTDGDWIILDNGAYESAGIPDVYLVEAIRIYDRSLGTRQSTSSMHGLINSQPFNGSTSHNPKKETSMDLWNPTQRQLMILGSLGWAFPALLLMLLQITRSHELISQEWSERIDQVLSYIVLVWLMVTCMSFLIWLKRG